MKTGCRLVVARGWGLKETVSAPQDEKALEMDGGGSCTTL